LCSLPGEERGLRGIRGKDLGGSAIAPLVTVDDGDSSVDVEGVGIEGVLQEQRMKFAVRVMQKMQQEKEAALLVEFQENYTILLKTRKILIQVKLAS